MSTSQYEMSQQDQNIILHQVEGNHLCMDCAKSNPRWASVTFGIVLCNDCCGVHRSLGTHISFCRSIDMDSWTPQQLQIMKMGGNTKCVNFFKQHDANDTNDDNHDHNDIKSRLERKYSSPVAQLYRQVLKARAEGLPEPTALPQPSTINTISATKKKISTQGFGSSPPPSHENTNQKWIVPVLVAAVSVGGYIVSSALSNS